MWTTEYTHIALAPPERVWEVLADVEGWAGWNDGVEHIALGGPVAVGATFRMTPSGGDTLTSTVAELVPGRRFTDVTEVDGVVVRVVHDLAPDEGGTRITYRVEVTAAGPEVEAGVGAGVSADFPEVLAALAAAATRT